MKTILKALSSEVAPIRVMIVVGALGYGGTERQVVELANRLPKDRFHVWVCAMTDEVPLATSLDLVRVNFVQILKYGRYDITVIFRLAWLLHRLHIDVAHGFLFDADIAVRIAGRLARVRRIFGSERNAEYPVSFLKKYALRLTKWLPHRIIANSYAGAAFNARITRLSTEHYTVVRNGVDVDRFRPLPRNSLRAHEGIAPEAFCIGMFASMKRQKNHILLLEAIKLCVPDIPNLVVLFVGGVLTCDRGSSAGYSGEVRQLVDDFGLAGICRFLGIRSDVVKLYNICDVTVLPSLYEGNPNVVLESMACSVPVIITDVADNRDLVNDGEQGYVVAPEPQIVAQRLRLLAYDRQLRSKLGKNARARIKREFTLDLMAQNMAKIYSENY